MMIPFSRKSLLIASLVALLLQSNFIVGLNLNNNAAARGRRIVTQQQAASSDSSSSSTTTATTKNPLSFPWVSNTPPSPPAPILVQGVGVDGCKLPSPSKINTLPIPLQAKTFVSSFAALALGTVALNGVLADATASYEWIQTWKYTWPLLGGVYVAAGITHFTPFQKEFENIYPPQGTWGIWYLPGSSEFHVKWTGIAEIVGGIGLLLGGAIDAFAPVYYSSPNILSTAGLLSDSAAGLFLLTLAVTPSNIYMYTHGAKIDLDGPPVPVEFHAVRGVLQIVLLSLLYQMGGGTFDAWFSYFSS